MSRKRCHSGSKRRGPSQGQFQSTSPQRSGYEDSLAAECLIRAFLDQGGMGEPILKVLFIGGSKPKQGETDYELVFKRLKICWLEKKERSYGMREVLRIKTMEKEIRVGTNPKWARFSLIEAPLIISPKIWISKQGGEKNFFFKFSNGYFQNNQILSETTVSIQKNGYLNTIAGMKAKMIIHKWDSFPDKDQQYVGKQTPREFIIFLWMTWTLYII